MAEVVENYFSHLFRTNAPDQRQILDCVEPKVDGGYEVVICAPFTKDQKGGV